MTFFVKRELESGLFHGGRSLIEEFARYVKELCLQQFGVSLGMIEAVG